MRTIVAVALAASILLAGCSSRSDGDEDESGEDEGQEPADDLPPGVRDDGVTEPAVDVVRLLSERVTYPRGIDESQASTEFVVPQDAVNLTIDLRAYLECPAGTQEDSAVVATDPDGNGTRLDLVPEVSWTLGGCPPGQYSAKTPETHELALAAGTWTLETAGKCWCDAQMIVYAGVA